MLSATPCYSEYDALAWFYNEVWGEETASLALQSVEQLLLPHLPKAAHILDLCCGSGQLAQKLLDKGYRVTGIDGSETMLRYARQNAPTGKFIQGDARFFKLPSTFHGVVSTTYALNYVLNIEELTLTFRNVYEALLDRGLFAFDLSLEERFQSSDWHGTMVGDIQDEYAWAERRIYKPEEKIGRVDTTLFKLVERVWKRLDNTTLMKCYSKDEIVWALKEVGFSEVRSFEATDEPAISISGKAYFVGRK